MRFFNCVFLVLFASCFPAFSQSKVTPASRSELSGIELPTGSKQDKRILATASAKTLLDMIAKDNEIILEEGVEVYTLIGTVGSHTVEEVKLAAQKAGWQLTTLSGQPKYWLLNKGTASLLMYLESNKRDTQLYLSAVKSKIALNTQAGNTTTNQMAAPPIKQPEIQPQQNSVTNTDSSILGTWVTSASDQSSWRVNNGVMSTISRQYTFNANGTYTFISKTFDPLMDKLLLGKESGTHQLSGNTITLRPQKSVLEAWSKKDGTDKWGNFLTSQNIALEQTTYRFSKHYFEGIQKWNLVLQADKETKRDGPFSGNTTFTNSWYYGPVSPTNNAIELPGEQQPTTQEIKKDPIQSAPTPNGKFTFTTINFDDGWVSNVREDWVEVTKSNVKVLIHYPNPTTNQYISDPDEAKRVAWNTLVAPRYSNLQNYFIARSGLSYIQGSFMSGTLTDKQTGQTFYVALFKRDRSPWIEFIAPNITAFGQATGFNVAVLNGDVSNSEWDPLQKLEGYNKFAVAPSDLTGTWTNNFSGFTQYVNAYTGADAGMNTHSSAQTFEFLSNGTYNWSISVASGFVGSIKFSGAKSTGKFSNPNNWQIHFSDLEGKPRLYNAYFSCVKGARILWLQDTGYGDYSSYGKKE
jgi:hypothetical protein